MGSLRHFLLDKFIAEYGTPYFVETGTGSGDGIDYARGFLFQKIYSIEIHDELCEHMRKKHVDDDRVALINARSDQGLDVLLQVLPQEKPILFWLDAHFPGAHCSKAAYDAEKDEDVRLPLESEINAIARRRRNHRDVILIDDLRIYEEGEFAIGNVPDDLLDSMPKVRNIDFIQNAFMASHFISRDYADGGYLLITPR